MRVKSEVFDKFFNNLHKRHPHTIRLEGAKKLGLSSKVCEALESGETVNGPNEHRMSLMKRSVRPWINWRREFEERHANEAQQILNENKPKKVWFVKIS